MLRAAWTNWSRTRDAGRPAIPRSHQEPTARPAAPTCASSARPGCDVIEWRYSKQQISVYLNRLLGYRSGLAVRGRGGRPGVPARRSTSSRRPRPPARRYGPQPQYSPAVNRTGSRRSRRGPGADARAGMRRPPTSKRPRPNRSGCRRRRSRQPLLLHRYCGSSSRQRFGDIARASGLRVHDLDLALQRFAEGAVVAASTAGDALAAAAREERRAGCRPRSWRSIVPARSAPWVGAATTRRASQPGRARHRHRARLQAVRLPGALPPVAAIPRPHSRHDVDDSRSRDGGA